ncbi:MAG: hypothetical protein Kow0090_17680 [Myxococcota bacterium]
MFSGESEGAMIRVFSAGIIVLGMVFFGCAPERIDITVAFCGPGYRLEKGADGKSHCVRKPGAEKPPEGGILPDINTEEGGEFGDGELTDSDDTEMDGEGGDAPPVETEGDDTGDDDAWIDDSEYGIELVVPEETIPVRGEVEIIVVPSKELEFERATLFIGSREYESVTQSPWQIHHNTAAVEDGVHDYQLVARWRSGVEKSYDFRITTDNTYPKLIIIKPRGENFYIDEFGRAEVSLRIEDVHGVSLVKLEAVSAQYTDKKSYVSDDEKTYEFEFVEMSDFLSSQMHFPPGNRWSERGVQIDFSVEVEDDVGNRGTYIFTKFLSKTAWEFEPDVEEGEQANILSSPRDVPGSDTTILPMNIISGDINDVSSYRTRIVAIDKETGEVVWSYETDGRYGSLSFTGDGDMVLRVLGSGDNGGDVFIYLTSAGDEIWRYNPSGGRQLGLPNLDASVNIYFQSDALLRNDATNKYEPARNAFVSSLSRNGELRWEKTHGGVVGGGMNIYESNIYVGYYDETTGKTTKLVNYGKEFGNVLWIFDEFSPLSYTGVLDGNIYIWRITEKGLSDKLVSVFYSDMAENWRKEKGADLPDAEFSVQTVFGGAPKDYKLMLVYYEKGLSYPTKIEEYRLPEGGFLWEFSRPFGERFYTASLGSSAFFAADFPEFANEPLRTLAVNDGDGSVKWTLERSGFPVSHGGNKFFLAHNDDESATAVKTYLIERYDPNSPGSAIWSYQSESGRVFSMGLYGLNGEMYLASRPKQGSQSDRIVALDFETGAVLWTYPLDGSFAIGADGKIYRMIVDENGMVSRMEAITP